MCLSLDINTNLDKSGFDEIRKRIGGPDPNIK